MMRYLKTILLFIICSVLSILIGFTHLPLAWLFGSLIGTLLFIRYFGTKFWYPRWFGDSGVFLMGFQIGSSLTAVALVAMLADLLNIVIISFLVLLMSLSLSRMFMKLTRSSLETAILASVPGALSQMLIMAEENKNADIMLVSLTQMSRIVLIVLIVPFIAQFFPSEGETGIVEFVPHLTEVFTPLMILIPLGGILMYVFLKKIKFPAAIMLGPVLVMIIWNLTTGITFTLDIALINFAQILFGIRIGLQISTLLSQLAKRLIFIILMQNILLITGTLVIVLIYQFFTTHSFNTLFLAAAPGGLAQIIVIALETGGDISIISSYHIFRIFFIILFIVPLIDFYLRRRASKA